MELETAVKNQIKEEVGDSELSLSEQKMLRQKYGVISPNLSDNPLDYSLPEFLKVKAFLLAMNDEHFKKGTWRHQWLMRKKEWKRRRNRNPQ